MFILENLNVNVVRGQAPIIWENLNIHIYIFRQVKARFSSQKQETRFSSQLSGNYFLIKILALEEQKHLRLVFTCNKIYREKKHAC